ncbi:hypothetical protein Tco_0221916 [Tanacetum coccineum]
MISYGLEDLDDFSHSGVPPKELSDKEVYKAAGEMEDAFPLNIEVQSQPPPSTEKAIPFEEQPHNEESPHPDSQQEEPHSTNSQPESSKLVKKKGKKSKESEPSFDPSNSESPSVSLSFKPYDNYMYVTKRVLARNL